jgi:hypothetical protein
MAPFDSEEYGPFMEGLIVWCQGVPKGVHFTLAFVGAILGYVYSFWSGDTPKVDVFVGAMIGLFFIPLMVEAVRWIVGLAIIGATLALLYCVFLVK